MKVSYKHLDGKLVKVIWENSELWIEAEFEKVKSAKNLWHYTIISEEVDNVIHVYSYAVYPTLIDVYLSVKIAIKNVDQVYEIGEPEFKQTLRKSKLQQLYYMQDRLREIIKEMIDAKDK